MMTKEKSERYLEYVKEAEGNRVFRFLSLLEQESVYDFSEQSSYEESILSREVKKYFSRYAAAEKIAVLTGKQKPDASILYDVESVLQLDAFEKMCVELAVLGEVNSYFEKFFIYMNNDWNNGYLSIDTAIRLYLMGDEADVEFYGYFEDDSKLIRYIFSFYGQEGKGRTRWGLKLRDCFFQLLFSKAKGFSKSFSFLKWYHAKEDDSTVYKDTKLFMQMDSIADRVPAGIYLCSEENSGEQIIRGYGSAKKHDICFINIRQLIILTEKNILNVTFPEFWYDILLAVKIQDAWICVHYCDLEFIKRESAVSLLWEMTETFLGNEVFLFITGEKPVLALEKDVRIWELWDKEENGDLHLWQKNAERYPVNNGVQLSIFSSTFRFTPVQIERIFQNAEKRRILDKRSLILQEDIREACVRETGRCGNNMITVMDTGYRFEDLILPDRQKEQLKTACNRALYRQKIYDVWGFGKKIRYGRGVSLLFSGSPGTGKTMSAGITASVLETTLYRVDLAAVVSKYIGETEKNLNAVFEAVKRGQGVLFFDEADVLFNKRVQVQNSNDRHSNMEAAYLLQKMEEYEGVVILATNYIQNIDEAFKRRIQFLIEFPFPDEDCRRQLWENVFPKQTRFDEIPDYHFLAKQFELSGSYIKNIALQAAFFAADAGRGICMEYIIKALLLEIRKAGKRISREDLKEYHMYYENI